MSLISSAFLSVCFLLILVLPVAQNLLHFAPEVKLPEQRQLRNYPPLEWQWEALSTFPTRFEAAFNDNFGFRPLLVQWQALAKFFWLKMSPSPKVIRGREGWFYLQNSINEHRGIQRLPKATVATWVREFRAKQAFLDARGIRYLIVIAPNKETIYPEFLPQDIRQIRKKLWLDDILEALPVNSDLDVLDLRAPLLEAKKLGRLYQRTDSHWTNLGVEVATNAILARLTSKCPGLKPDKIDRALPVAWGKSGDLARLMGLQNHLREEAIMIVPPDKLVRAGDLRYHGSLEGLRIPPSVVESLDPEGDCSLIVAGDSFSEVISRFLSAHFWRTLRLRPLVAYPAAFEKSLPALIEAERPDVYIELLVDRNLFLPPEVIFSSKEKVKN